MLDDSNNNHYQFNTDYNSNSFNRHTAQSQNFNSQHFNQNPNYIFNKINPPIIHPSYNQIPGYTNFNNDYQQSNHLGKDGSYYGGMGRENINYFQKPLNSINNMNHINNMNNMNNINSINLVHGISNMNNINNINLNNMGNINSNNMNHNMTNNMNSNSTMYSNENTYDSESNPISNLRENLKSTNIVNSETGKTVQNYTDMNDEELARHCYVLAKDQGGCRFLQKKVEDSSDFTNQYLFPNVIT